MISLPNDELGRDANIDVLDTLPVAYDDGILPTFLPAPVPSNILPPRSADGIMTPNPPAAAKVTIPGRLRDQYGNVIAGAEVDASDVNGNVFTAVADENGEFLIGVPAGGVYILTARSPYYDFAPVTFNTFSANLVELTIQGVYNWGPGDAQPYDPRHPLPPVYDPPQRYDLGLDAPADPVTGSQRFDPLQPVQSSGGPTGIMTLPPILDVLNGDASGDASPVGLVSYNGGTPTGPDGIMTATAPESTPISAELSPDGTMTVGHEAGTPVAAGAGTSAVDPAAAATPATGILATIESTVKNITPTEWAFIGGAAFLMFGGLGSIGSSSSKKSGGYLS